MDVFFMGLTDSMISAELDEYQGNYHPLDYVEDDDPEPDYSSDFEPYIEGVIEEEAA